MGVFEAVAADPDLEWLAIDATPLNDFMTKNGRIREDGRVLRDFYVFLVKSPEESKGPWDYYEKIATISAEDAARPLAESECSLVKKQSCFVRVANSRLEQLYRQNALRTASISGTKNRHDIVNRLDRPQIGFDEGIPQSGFRNTRQYLLVDAKL